jgi:pimeloyl-ACP methyl ester carboxylesterase
MNNTYQNHFKTNYLQTILYQQIPISYSDYGKGKAVVLIHGFLENQHIWNDLISKLCITNRVVTLDLLGHGLTPCLGYVHTMEQQAALVVAVMNSLGIDGAIFIGHSMGGYVAMAIAELNPEYVSGLVLLNSTAAADDSERKANRDRAITAVKHNHVNFINIAIGNLFGPDHRDTFIKEIDIIKSEALKTPLQGIIAALEGMKIRNERTDLFKNINVPKALILGQKDPVLPFEMNIRQANDSISVHALSGGHMSYIENKEEIATIISNFVQSI